MIGWRGRRTGGGIKPWIAELPEYVPGEAPREGELGKLSSNESPYGPTERVLEAIARAAGRVNRYPDPLARDLCRAISRTANIRPESVVVGNGSDELIYLLALAHLGPGSVAAVADPPYLMHEIASRALGATVVRVPLRGYRHDLDRMAGEKADLVFVTNPHNPTGTAVSRAELRAFVERSVAGLIVVDEAYVDFADDPEEMTALPLVQTGRVVVLRTFSKLYGLAGARVGYLVASPEITRDLRRLRPPFSVNALAQAAAAAALSEKEHIERVRASIRETREKMAGIFRTAGYAVIPSQANFVLVKTPDESRLVELLKTAGLTVRPGSTLGLPGHVRVSVALPEVLPRLREALVG